MPEVIFLKGRYGYRSKKQYGIRKNGLALSLLLGWIACASAAFAAAREF